MSPEKPLVPRFLFPPSPINCHPRPVIVIKLRRISMRDEGANKRERSGTVTRRCLWRIERKKVRDHRNAFFKYLLLNSRRSLKPAVFGFAWIRSRLFENEMKLSKRESSLEKTSQTNYRIIERFFYVRNKTPGLEQQMNTLGRTMLVRLNVTVSRLVRGKG